MELLLIMLALLLLLLRVTAEGAALVGVQAQQQGVVGGLDVLCPSVTRYLQHVVPRYQCCHWKTAFDAQGLASRIGVAPQRNVALHTSPLPIHSCFAPTHRLQRRLVTQQRQPTRLYAPESFNPITRSTVATVHVTWVLRS